MKKNHILKNCFLLFVSTLLIGGCDSGTTPSGIGNDAEPQYIKGGGTNGGKIDGRLNVFVYDDDTDKPIKEAFVMLGPGPEPDFWGFTDETGLITFRNSNIDGPQELTVYKEGFPLSVMFGLDAANITLSMKPTTPVETATVETATVKGKVTGLDKIDTPPAGSFKLAVVSFTLPSIFTPEFEDVQKIEQPPGNLNLVSPQMQRDTYELTTRVGKHAVYALGGIYTPGQNNQADTFELKFLGLTDITTKKDEMKEGIDIDLSIPLSKPAKILVTKLPKGSDSAGGIVLLDMNDRGTILFSLSGDREGKELTTSLPELAGDLDGSSLTLFVQAFKQVCQGQGDQENCTEEPPSSIKIEKKVALKDLENKEVYDLLEPLEEMDVDTNSWSFSFKAPSDIDIITSDLVIKGATEDEDQKLASVTLFNSSMDSFALPELPDTSGFNGFSSKDITWQGGAMRFDSGTDPFNIHFDDIGKFITHMSQAEKSLAQ
ncbi:MAG: hypothetical protein GXP49_05375 [Deltaproteobacteria bacterium]|nr:hypothetical protein [Deltaproteobacteria bacterium]